MGAYKEYGYKNGGKKPELNRIVRELSAKRPPWYVRVKQHPPVQVVERNRIEAAMNAILPAKAQFKDPILHVPDR